MKKYLKKIKRKHIVIITVIAFVIHFLMIAGLENLMFDIFLNIFGNEEKNILTISEFVYRLGITLEVTFIVGFIVLIIDGFRKNKLFS